jgi:hypothetical protein
MIPIAGCIVGPVISYWRIKQEQRRTLPLSGMIYLLQYSIIFRLLPSFVMAVRQTPFSQGARNVRYENALAKNRR